MTIQTHTTDRKALARAIATELGTTVNYMGMPTCNYQVGDFIIDREGNIIGDDFTALHNFLLAQGFVEAEPGVDGEAAAQPTVQETNENDSEPGETPEAEQPPACTSEANGDVLTITLPTPDITVEQLQNLTYLLYSRQHIINLMAQGDTLCVPLELIETLQEALPATPEDFSRLLDTFAEFGLKGFDFKAGEFSLTFPLYEAEPDKLTAFAGLQGRILLAARAAKRVFPELMKPEEEEEKYMAHTWLLRLGYKGPEMKTERNLLLKHLHGYCAFGNAEKMQKHKDKYSAIRRERREAAREAAAEDTSAQETNDVATSEEVTGND